MRKRSIPTPLKPPVEWSALPPASPLSSHFPTTFLIQAKGSEMHLAAGGWSAKLPVHQVLVILCHLSPRTSHIQLRALGLASSLGLCCYHHTYIVQ